MLRSHVRGAFSAKFKASMQAIYADVGEKKHLCYLALLVYFVAETCKVQSNVKFDLEGPSIHESMIYKTQLDSMMISLLLG